MLQHQNRLYSMVHSMVQHGIGWCNILLTIAIAWYAKCSSPDSENLWWHVSQWVFHSQPWVFDRRIAARARAPQAPAFGAFPAFSNRLWGYDSDMMIFAWAGRGCLIFYSVWLPWSVWLGVLLSGWCGWLWGDAWFGIHGFFLPLKTKFQAIRKMSKYTHKQWIGLRENLQETIDFPIKYGDFL